MQALARITSSAVAMLAMACGYPTYTYLDEAEAGPDDGTVDDAPATPDGVVTETCVPNGCGGCNDQGVKGERCDPGASFGGCGQWTCWGRIVTCARAEPAAGTKCGRCGTSTNVCGPFGTTTCNKEDDRSTFEDVGFKATGDKLIVVDRVNEIVATYKVTRALEYLDASFVVRRVPYACSKVSATPHPDPECDTCKPATGSGFDCTVSTPTVGTVTVTFYDGAPPSLVPVASVSVDAATLPTTAGFHPFLFPTAVGERPIGSVVSIGISTDSSTHAVEIYGGNASSSPKPPADLGWSRRTRLPTESGWTAQPSNDVGLVVRGKACPS